MTKPKAPTAADKLEAMAATFRERNAVYGDNFIRLGNAMHAMFPQGLTLNSADDWTRLYFFMLQQVKQSRYATNFNRGGHPDSVHDTAVYAALLEVFDENIRARQATDNQVGASDGAKAQAAPARTQANGRRRQR
jgi:hypothetical protein